MSQEIFCVAHSPIQARGLVARIGDIGILPRNITVTGQPWEVDDVARPDAQILHDAKLGFAIGAATGWFLGTAILIMVATPATTVYEALLFLMAGGMGGAVLGTVFAAAGVFGTSCMPRALERHYEDEVGRGGILVAVEFQDQAERNRVETAMDDFGASDIHDSGEMAA